MKRPQLLRSLLLACVWLAAHAYAAEPVKVVVLEPGQGRLEELLRHEVAAAAALGKRPYVQITAEWCGPCKALRASLGDPLMQDAFAGTYIVQVDFDAWKPELEQGGFKNEGIPVFFAVDGDARPTGAKIDGGAWGEDIPRNMAPPLKQFFTAQRAGR
ncbi:MAG TPA: thioredoxin domain-containing protein [Gammaproteobacteria bacterium]|nr:thioredoxin domain-containing protein [Gammaproteobacteria bacterium]